MTKKVVSAIPLLLCLFALSVGQTKTDDDVVRITTNLVQVDVVVTKNGKPVRDLKAEDFEIFEDGKRQEITSFAFVSSGGSTTPATSSKDPNAPAPVPGTPADAAPADGSRRMIALVIDDLGLSAPSIAEVRRQMAKFIDEQLNANDLVAIIRTSHARRELPHFTNDRNRINQTLEEVKWNNCSRVDVKAMPRIGAMPNIGCGNGANSFDESIDSLRAIVTDMGRVPGRKSMIIFSDDMPLRESERLTRGDSVLSPDNKSKEAATYTARLITLAELSIRSSVVIYAVDTSGLQTTHTTAADATIRPNVAGSEGNALYVQELRNRWKLIQTRRDGAQLIAKATGGFLIHDQNNFQFDKILEDQSTYYLIGYRPGSETFDKKFHKLGARVKKGGYQVRTRSGFMGLSDEDAKRLKETTKK